MYLQFYFIAFVLTMDTEYNQSSTSQNYTQENVDQTSITKFSFFIPSKALHLDVNIHKIKGFVVEARISQSLLYLVFGKETKILQSINENCSIIHHDSYKNYIKYDYLIDIVLPQPTKSISQSFTPNKTLIKMGRYELDHVLCDFILPGLTDSNPSGGGSFYIGLQGYKIYNERTNSINLGFGFKIFPFDTKDNETDTLELDATSMIFFNLSNYIEQCYLKNLVINIKFV